VVVDGAAIGAIQAGLLIYLGVGRADAESDADALVEKIVNLRLFADPAGKMNLSVKDIGAELLVVSQFTLYADCRRGRRPSFESAAAPELARTLYERFTARLRTSGLKVASGRFAAKMQVRSTNDGPVTVWLDSAG
jgi:D-tyrosyl-tRNA(Tyr) deacylase